MAALVEPRRHGGDRLVLGVGIGGGIGGRLAQVGLEALAGQEDVVADVVFKDARDGNLHHGAVAQLHGQAVAHRNARQAQELVADHRAVPLGPGHRRAVVGEAEEGGDVGIVRRHHRNAADAALGEHLHGLHRGEGQVGEVLGRLFPESLLLLRSLILVKGDGVVVEGDGAVLILRHIGHGIPEAQAGHQQRQTAAHAQQHHHQPLFIAEDVAGRDLLQEAHPPPQDRHPLQEDALAGLGCLGPHQNGGHLAHLAVGGGQRRAHGAEKRHRQGHQPQHRVKDVGDLAEAVNDLIGVPDDQGEEPRPQTEAQQAAADGGQAGVEDVPAHDLLVAVAQGLEGAVLGALLFHHPRHGGGADQRRHQEEEDREDGGQPLDDGSVAVEVGVAGVGGAGQCVVRRVAEIVQLRLAVLELHQSVVQLLFGVGQLLLRLQLALLIFFQAVLVLGPAVVQLDPGVGQFLLALGQGVLVAALVVRFALGEVGVGVVQLLLAVRQLLLGIGQLLDAVVILLEAFVIFLPAVVQLLPGLVQLLLAALHGHLVALVIGGFAAPQGGVGLVQLGLAGVQLRLAGLCRLHLGLIGFVGTVILRPGGFQRLLRHGAAVRCLLQPGALRLQLGAVGVQLGLARLVLRQACLVLGKAVTVLAPADVQLPAGFGHLLVAQGIFHQFFICLQALGVFGLAVVQLLLGLVQLRLGVVQLRLVLRHGVLIFPETVVIFPEAVVVLGPAVVQLLAGVGQLLVAQRVLPQGLQSLHALGVVGLAVLEFLQRVVQLLLAVGQLLLRLQLAVFIFLEAVLILGPAVRKLRLGVGDQLLLPQRTPQRHLVLQRRLPLVGERFVGVGEGVGILVQLHVDGGIVLRVVARSGQEQEGGHAAVSQGRGAPLAV